MSVLMCWSKVLLNSNSIKLIVITLLWVIIVVATLVFAYTQQTDTFDPDNTLSQPNWLSLFQNTVGLNAVEGDTLYIVDENTCVCSARSQAHIQSLTDYAIEQGVKVVKLAPSTALSSLIPAQPAAVLISANQELAYAGPLSKGLACSSQNGFVELVIKNLRAGFNSQFVNSNAEGCYCKIG